MLAATVIPVFFVFHDYPGLPWWDFFIILPGIEMLVLPAGLVMDYYDFGNTRSLKSPQKRAQIKATFVLLSVVAGISVAGAIHTEQEIARAGSPAYLVDNQVIVMQPLHQWLNYTFPDIQGDDLRVSIHCEAITNCDEIAIVNMTWAIYQSGMLVKRIDAYDNGSIDCELRNAVQGSHADAYYNIQGFDPTLMHNISIEIEAFHVPTNRVEQVSIIIYDMTLFTRLWLNQNNLRTHFYLPLGFSIAGIVAGAIFAEKQVLLERGAQERSMRGKEQNKERAAKIAKRIELWKRSRV